MGTCSILPNRRNSKKNSQTSLTNKVAQRGRVELGRGRGVAVRPVELRRGDRGHVVRGSRHASQQHSLSTVQSTLAKPAVHTWSAHLTTRNNAHIQRANSMVGVGQGVFPGRGRLVAASAGGSWSPSKSERRTRPSSKKSGVRSVHNFYFQNSCLQKTYSHTQLGN